MVLSACSTNPATGERQFTSLMSPEKEKQIGAQEHQKALKQFGGIYKNKELTDYISRIGQALAKNTERGDVEYKFFLLDSPEANAFAIPGGYIYITRGILALANNEAELAAVIGHEIGHITGRHSAERYSHTVVTSLGAAILGAAVNDKSVSDAASYGAGLYLNSYSRSQENEADMLGVRYLHRAGYDVTAMTGFLKSLGAFSKLEAQANGDNNGPRVEYLSTHPLTENRVVNTVKESGRYPANAKAVHKKSYLKKINGVAWGSSKAQGFVRNNEFIHPEMGFKFTAPEFAKIVNRPSEILITANDQAHKGVAVFDIGSARQELSPTAYIEYEWMKKEPLQGVESIKINGLDAATAVFPGHINGNAAQIRLVAIAWAPKKFIRFQIALPSSLSAADNEAYKKMTYSFKRIDKKSVGDGDIIALTLARQGDNVDALSKLQESVFNEYSSAYFRVLNGLPVQQNNVKAGELYKVIKRD
jgi:predicted Zn-dependent protease